MSALEERQGLALAAAQALTLQNKMHWELKSFCGRT